MLVRWIVCVGAVLALVGCTDEPSTETSGPGGSGGSGGGVSQGGGGMSQGGGTSTELCSADLLAEPTTATTYYVAIDEPGADNEACDGLAPTDEGNGHCPWKDFTHDRPLRALDSAADARLEVRAGTYAVHTWDGIRVTGEGRSADEPVVLSAYPGEHPILDVAQPDGAGCTTGDPMTKRECVRQVVRVSGRHAIVQGFTIRNGLGYHLEVTGAEDALVRCNRFEETVAFSQRSDQLKIDSRSQRVTIEDNELTKFRSQAIDLTESFDVVIQGNDFHDPVDPQAGAVGMKLGAARVVIRDNDVHDLGPDPSGQHAFSLGGTGFNGFVSGDYIAHEIQVANNRVWNVVGIVAQVVACENCTITGNDIWDVGGGIRVTNAALGDTEQCPDAPAGCAPSSSLELGGNRMRHLYGDMQPGSGDVFLWVDAGEGAGLTSSTNLYCATDPSGARFGWQGESLAFDAWKSQTGTDASSTLSDLDAPACDF